MSFATESPSSLDTLALSRVSLFTRLDLEKFKPLLAHCETRELTSGEVLLRADQHTDCMYVVLEGQLAIHTRVAEQAVATLIEGQTFGEMAIIGAQQIRALIRAAAPSRVALMGKDKLWQLMGAHPDFARTLIQMFATRLFKFTNASFRDHHFHQESQFELHLDEQTGLYDSRWLSECLADEMSRCAARNRPLSLLAVAIDGFESRYQSLGEVVAEQALEAVSNAVQIALRALDLAFRYQHERIMVLLPGANIFEGERLANRLHQAVKHISIMGPQDRSIEDISISVGISEMAEVEYADIFIARVNAALQRATENGGNRTSQ